MDFNGDRVSDSFDKTRLEQILRELEAEFKLTKVVSSNICDCAPRTQHTNRQRPKNNQLKRYQKESREYQGQQRDTPPEIPVMAMLEAAIDAASQDRPTMTSFIARMQQLEIDVRPYITDKGSKRISYRLEDFQVRGSKLHNGSFPKLISDRDHLPLFKLIFSFNFLSIVVFSIPYCDYLLGVLSPREVRHLEKVTSV